MESTISLSEARWKLAKIWFPFAGAVVLLLALQSIMGMYGEDIHRAFGWALPNFLPTIALMISVFGQDALVDDPKIAIKTRVKTRFLKLTSYLSIFYVVAFLIPLAAAPFQTDLNPIEAMEIANIWLGATQSLVVAAIGVLFFTREEKKNGSDG